MILLSLSPSLLLSLKSNIFSTKAATALKRETSIRLCDSLLGGALSGDAECLSLGRDEVTPSLGVC